MNFNNTHGEFEWILITHGEFGWFLITHGEFGEYGGITCKNPKKYTIINHHISTRDIDRG